jgi:hypothetical protein
MNIQKDFIFGGQLATSRVKKLDILCQIVSDPTPRRDMFLFAWK